MVHAMCVLVRRGGKVCRQTTWTSGNDFPNCEAIEPIAASFYRNVIDSVQMEVV